MTTSGAASERSAWRSQLDDFIGTALNVWETPGLIISAVRNDEVVLAAGYGAKELGTQGAPTEHTPFAIGSLSKAFGAASVAALVDRNRLAWDDRVIQHLPWFELHDPSVTREVRVRDLLAHRVGSDFMIEDRLVPVLADASDFVRRLRYLPPAASFGSKYVYSNGMFVAAGLVVEAVTRTPWAAFTREALWEPLGMHRTTADFRAVLRSGRQATPHWRIGNAVQPLPGWGVERNAFDISGPSGSIISTASDMAQWLRLQLGKGVYAGRRVVSESAMKEMHTPHTPIGGDLRDVIYWFTHLQAADLKTTHWAYGLGWWITDFRGQTMLCHTGTAAGFRGAVLLLPEERLGVYVGVNFPTVLPFVTALTTVDLLTGDADTDWNAMFVEQARQQDEERRLEEQQRHAARATNTTPSLPLTRYEGIYTDNGALGSLRIFLEKGRLVVEVGYEQADLEHWCHDEFVLHWRALVPRQTVLRFNIDMTGRVERLHIEGSGTFVRHDPIPKGVAGHLSEPPN